MQMTREKMLSTPIETLEAAKAFIRWLGDEDLSFHFDDRVEQIVDIRTGERVFTDEEVPLVNARTEEIFGFEYGEDECPFGYAIRVWNAD